MIKHISHQLRHIKPKYMLFGSLVLSRCFKYLPLSLGLLLTDPFLLDCNKISPSSLINNIHLHLLPYIHLKKCAPSGDFN